MSDLFDNLLYGLLEKAPSWLGKLLVPDSSPKEQDAVGCLTILGVFVLFIVTMYVSSLQ